MSLIKKLAVLVLKFQNKMGRDKIRAHSAEAGFFIIMSFFPILMLLLTMIRYTPLTQDQLLYAIEEITPFEVVDVLEDTVHSIYNQSVALLSTTAIAAIWAAGKGIMGLSDGLNSIFQITDTRNYFVARFRYTFYTLILIVALVLSLGILVFGFSILDYLLGRFPMLRQYQDMLVVLPTGVALVVLVFLFTVLYMFLPNRRQTFRSQFPGAVFTAVSWSVFSYAFSIYLDYAVNMSVIYGSLTTLVVVMLWLYFCMYLLFMGAEVNQYIANPELFTLDR